MNNDNAVRGKCLLCSFFNIEKLCCLCTATNNHFQPKESFMSNNFCPAGKIECENHIPGDVNINCKTKTNNESSVYFFEQCPWPSKQKKVKDKYETAFTFFFTELYSGKLGGRADFMLIQMFKDDFIEACKKAELK